MEEQMKDIFQSVLDDIIEKLEDEVGLDAYGCDLQRAMQYRLFHHKHLSS